MLPELLRQMGFETPPETGRRPLLGVSACLLGRPVRYDGGHRRSERVEDQLGKLVRFTEVCPEVAIGLPVPRPPIQVVNIGEQLRVRGVAPPEHDHTDALTAQARGMAEPLSGFVFKSRSPSCGLGTTPIHDPQGQPRGLGDGAYAAALAAHYPRIPLCNESDLEDPRFLCAFVVHLYCHHQWRHSRRREQSLNTLRRRSEGLDEPLLSDTRRFLDRLADTG